MSAQLFVHPAVLSRPIKVTCLELATGLRAVWGDSGRYAVLVPHPRHVRAVPADVTDVSDYIGDPPKGAA